MGKNSKHRRDAKLKKKLMQKNKKQIVKPDISETLTDERKEYIDNWSNGNAALFEEHGHYQWMSGQLGEFEKVLEIGTGDGRCTLELARRGHKIISIDENPLCIDAAKERLSAAGINIVKLSREKIVRTLDYYKIEYSEILTSPDEAQVLLIEGDINNDPYLIDWLLNQKPFDCVTCALIGTHGGRQYNDHIIARGVASSGDYRLMVQNRVYEIADKILRKNGVLQAVDRCEIPDNDLIREDFLNSHREQASVTSLVVESLAYKEYEEPQTNQKIEMCCTLPLSGRVPTMVKTALVSILSKKS